MEDRAKRWLHFARQHHIFASLSWSTGSIEGEEKQKIKTVEFTVSIRDANSAAVLGVGGGANETKGTRMLNVDFVVVDI